jgi:hypothetical protein
VKFTRRFLLQSPSIGLLQKSSPESFSRRAQIQRHNPTLHALDPLSPLSVGNGEFAFTADITGLQTFPEKYEQGIPLCTQSQWGWHSIPAPAGLRAADLVLTPYDAHGRQVGYATGQDGQRPLFNWLRENPHRLNLGRIGLALKRADGSAGRWEDVTGIDQQLDLWTGVLRSRFQFEGESVVVETMCHPESDTVAVVVESALVARGLLAVELAFPYGSPAINASDWLAAAKHVTELNGRVLRRRLDGTEYWVALESAEGVASMSGAHVCRVSPRAGASRLSLACRFTRSAPSGATPAAGQVRAASVAHWQRFWSSGGAIDFSQCQDSRAVELGRRAVLSQYLTAIQCAGSLPPQETGLTCNSWYGKFHLEMHWWHAVHFVYWNRAPLLERSLGYYSAILPAARALARQQGYRGARWPKMVGPEGRDSPSNIGPLLIWQQPHPVYYAELCYYAHPDAATLARYRDVVFETAEFMASYAWYDAGRARFVLGPPVIPAQENHPPRETWNPTFELSYWRWALGVAQRWRERLGMPRQPEWERVRTGLAPSPERDGVYLAHENCPQTYTERNRDHPSMLAALGVLPGDGADAETMRRTLRKVMQSWKWEDTWGWDYPMVAMTAARLGERELAVDALLMETPKNRYLPNGHNWQRPGLHLYLPGNGGLLTALALMAAGWRGGPAEQNPGFPKTGWAVRHEGLRAVL